MPLGRKPVGPCIALAQAAIGVAVGLTVLGIEESPDGGTHALVRYDAPAGSPAVHVAVTVYENLAVSG